MSQTSGSNTEQRDQMDHREVATFGAGCFWCVEALFQTIDGVESVVSGYSGGDVANPSYEEVCTGTTGHAEVCQITYDPSKVTYGELLKVFWQIHDPTTLNRQGADVGTQYRSVIFYHNEEQKREAETCKQELDESGIWKNPVVTEISPCKNFYRAEGYHQDYYNQNADKPYSALVITPKMKKLKQAFKAKVKQ